MLLTITYSGENAADLGYLLHKNPSRPQTAEFNFGKVHIFYPEISENRCTAALLLDMDPLDLARGRQGSTQRGLFDYINDRPYVSSSFMSTAISRVYGTAMAGRCESRQALADSDLELCASIVMLPCRSDTGMLERIFAPLGYEVEWTGDLQPGGLGIGSLLDERFPEWGNSCYVNLTIRGKIRLRELLRHLYVLIPVFDNRKHYWIGGEEVDKLLAHGEGWLENHPEKVFITRRYFKKFGHFTRLALKRLDRLDNGEGGAEIEEAEADIPAEEETVITEKQLRLNDERLLAVLAALKASGAQSIIDMGCGEGNLLRLLIKEKIFTAIAGTDVSAAVLSKAAERLKIDRFTGEQKKRITLFQSSLCCRDKRFKNYDAAAIVEVIEHMDENRLPAFESVVFGDAAPAVIIITTPNAAYNVNYPGLAAGRFRHGDHRFEWNADQFHAWANSIAARYGYSVCYEDIGEKDAETGTPTQMAIFRKNAPEKAAPSGAGI